MLFNELVSDADNMHDRKNARALEIIPSGGNRIRKEPANVAGPAGEPGWARRKKASGDKDIVPMIMEPKLAGGMIVNGSDYARTEAGIQAAYGELAAMTSIPNFAHMRPNCVLGSSPRNRSPGVAGRLYRFFQSTYNASGTP